MPEEDGALLDLIGLLLRQLRSLDDEAESLGLPAEERGSSDLEAELERARAARAAARDAAPDETAAMLAAQLEVAESSLARVETRLASLSPDAAELLASTLAAARAADEPGPQ